MVLNYLKENYIQGEPIFLTDLKILNITEENLRYYLKKYTDNGILCRFESGIYYFPKKNLFGEISVLSVDDVVINKYIRRKGNRVGFYSGHTLANRMGLSTQVPIKEEIVSNYAPAPVRELQIKNRKYVIRRPVQEINEKNIFVLQLLDCLKNIDQCTDVDMESCGDVLTRYINDHDITKEKIDQFIGSYPTKIYKAIYETGIKYVSTRR